MFVPYMCSFTHSTINSKTNSLLIVSIVETFNLQIKSVLHNHKE